MASFSPLFTSGIILSLNHFLSTNHSDKENKKRKEYVGHYTQSHVKCDLVVRIPDFQSHLIAIMGTLVLTVVTKLTTELENVVVSLYTSGHFMLISKSFEVCNATNAFPIRK